MQAVLENDGPAEFEAWWNHGRDGAGETACIECTWKVIPPICWTVKLFVPWGIVRQPKRKARGFVLIYMYASLDYECVNERLLVNVHGAYFLRFILEEFKY